MTKSNARDPIYRYRYRGFDAEAIWLCLRWHITDHLSYCDLGERLAERGVAFTQSTTLRWV